MLPDDGFALAAVVGIIALLTVVGVGSFAVARQALTESEVVKNDSYAFQAANGAVDAAIAQVQLSGYQTADFPMSFGQEVFGSAAATVTVTQPNPSEYLFTSVGTSKSGMSETVKVRLYLMDLYGMNIAYGSGFNQSSGGKFNGNASVYGPFYTYDDLRQGENLGTSLAGGFGWGPVYIKGGTLDVKSGYLIDVSHLYVEASEPDPKVVNTAETKVIRSVPNMKVPRVDEAYLTGAYNDAIAESTDNIQGDPEVRTVVNSEPTPYPRTLCPGASTGAYKVVDNDTTMNASHPGLTLGNGVSFGDPVNDDFAWNAGTRTLTVWGTVFIDGPLTFAGGDITYVGNGALIANGDVVINDKMTPSGGLLPGVCGDGVTRNNQSFDPGKVLGIASPGKIELFGSPANTSNPDGAPSHAGAFFADEEIVISGGGVKTHLVGSLISQGINVTGNNNMDLRTSPNLGENVPHSMPGYGMMIESIGIWARQ